MRTPSKRLDCLAASGSAGAPLTRSGRQHGQWPSLPGAGLLSFLLAAVILVELYLSGSRSGRRPRWRRSSAGRGAAGWGLGRRRRGAYRRRREHRRQSAPVRPPKRAGPISPDRRRARYSSCTRGRQVTMTTSRADPSWHLPGRSAASPDSVRACPLGKAPRATWRRICAQRRWLCRRADTSASRMIEPGAADLRSLMVFRLGIVPWTPTMAPSAKVWGATLASSSGTATGAPRRVRPPSRPHRPLPRPAVADLYPRPGRRVMPPASPWSNCRTPRPTM